LQYLTLTRAAQSKHGKLWSLDLWVVAALDPKKLPLPMMSMRVVKI